MGLDFSDLRTSWTKYDIVRVMEVVHDAETIEQFRQGKTGIDEPILRSFLGVKSLGDPTPKYWLDIQNYPNEKPLFALFAVLFTHGGVINEFAEKYSTGNMGGVFKIEEGKQYTNIRAALIESGAALPSLRRSTEVPFDFSPIFQNREVGRLFKMLLLERLSRFTSIPFTDHAFYETCFQNKFHQALSVTKDQLRTWLEGEGEFNSSLIRKVKISNFFSIEEVELDFGKSNEIYFLGENGDGKSLILMAIFLAFNGNYVLEKTEKKKTGLVADIVRNNKQLRLTGIDENGVEYGPNKARSIGTLFGYGTHRGRFSSDDAEEYGFMSLFSSEQTLNNPLTWLKDQKLLELEDSKDGAHTEKNGRLGYFSTTLLQEAFHELLERNVEITILGTEVIFREKGTNLSFDQLSEGYRSIIIFASDLLFRLTKDIKDGEIATERKGVVLVDEIDLHLHPKWQRNILRKFRNLFPNIQFIFTTHSPTIIQGATENAIIFRVYRDSADGKTRVSEPYFRKDLNHLMIDALLTSPMFGMTDSRMNSDDNFSDTSETYLLYRINKKLEDELKKQKSAGKSFISDEAIDKLIDEILRVEQKKIQDGQD